MKSKRVITFSDHGCYCLTLETVDLIDIFIRPVYKQIIVHTINHYIHTKGLIVYGWCLMPNRLYIISKAQLNTSLKDIRADFKQFTTDKIIEAIYNEPSERQQWMIAHFQKNPGFFGPQKSPEVWKKVKDMVPIDVNKPEMMASRLEFIHNIPVQERIVAYGSDFIYSSAKDYETGQQGLIKIERLPLVEQALDDIENRKSIFKSKSNRSN